MAYLKRFGGLNLYKIENGYIKDFSTAFIKYKIEGDRIKDFYGRIMLVVTNGQIKEFSGRIIARFDGKNIKDFYGMTQYQIEGQVSRNELMAIFAMIFII